MDQMLPSPGFSIPSIGTPLHQPEEDQQILPNAYQQQQQQQMQIPPMSMGFGNQNSSSGLMGSSIMSTPMKSIHTYAPSFTTPQSLIQPQTPVFF